MASDRIMASGFITDLLYLTDQPGSRHDIGAVGKHVACERALLGPQVIPEQTLEHRTQIGGWFEIASLIKLGGLQSWPVGDDASAPQCASGEKGDGARTMVGSVGAVDVRGASKLRDDGDHRILPGVAHVGLDGRERAVERSQQIGELS